MISLTGLTSCSCTTALAVVGALVLARFALTFVCAIYKYFLRGGKNLRNYGEWAVVTGATDGIGKAYALALAQRGLGVVLVSRTQSKLDETAAEITSQVSGAKVQSIVADFGNFDARTEGRVRDALSKLDIGVLVNNVGASYSTPEYFNGISDDMVRDLISLNINSTLAMTRIVLPIMERNKRGSIINISSASSLNPVPLLAEYGAAKAFVTHFSESLAQEYGHKGIHVQVQVPFYIVSKLSKFKKSSFNIPSPQKYVNIALRHVGYETVSNPYWPHAFQMWLTTLLPRWVVGKYVFGMHDKIRRYVLKKATTAAPADRNKQQ